MVKRVDMKLTTRPELVLSAPVPVPVTLGVVLKVIFSLVSKCVDICTVVHIAASEVVQFVLK